MLFLGGVTVFFVLTQQAMSGEVLPSYPELGYKTVNTN